MQRINLNTFEEEAIFLNGYYIEKENFRPVYKKSNKNDRAWKAPRSIKSLIENPALFFTHENFVFDEKAMNLELKELKKEIPKEVAKIQYIFENANNIYSANYEDIFDKDGDIERIEKVMDDVLMHDEFRTAIEPMEEAHGYYAFPNNLNFEMLNAGVTKIFSEKKPNVKILDDLLRSPIYELTNNINTEIPEFDDLTNLLETAREKTTPLPYFGNDWSPVDLVSKLNSEETKQLRKVLGEIDSQNMDNLKIGNLLEEAKDLSKFVSPIDKTAMTVFDFIVRTAAIAGLAITLGPIYYIPSAIKFGASAYFLTRDTYKLVDYLDNARVAPNCKWYNVISYIMYLNQMEKENDIQ